MKTYYWLRLNKNGTSSEGKYTMTRRVFGRLFLGETYFKHGEWYDNL